MCVARTSSAHGTHVVSSPCSNVKCAKTSIKYVSFQIQRSHLTCASHASAALIVHICLFANV